MFNFILVKQTVDLEAAVFRPDGLNAACCHFFLFVSDEKLSFTSSSTNEMVTLQLGPNMLCYFSTRVFSRIIEYLHKKY